MGLKSLTIVPMGGPPPKEEKKEEPASEEDSDGLRESYDEFVESFNDGDHDLAFEALKNFVDMCALKAVRDEY